MISSIVKNINTTPYSSRQASPFNSERHLFVQIFDTSHIETEQYYMNILSEDLKPIVSDLRTVHMKDSDTASDVDYQSMVKSIIDDFTSHHIKKSICYLKSLIIKSINIDF